MSWTQGTWSTSEQIRDHKFACSVVNLHGTPDSVFDDERLDELKRFTLNRSVATRDRMMAEEGWADSPDGRTGKGAAAKGSLTGHIIVRYGTDDEALDGRDWELLEEWFQKGMPVGEQVAAMNAASVQAK